MPIQYENFKVKDFSAFFSKVGLNALLAYFDLYKIERGL